MKASDILNGAKGILSFPPEYAPIARIRNVNVPLAPVGYPNPEGTLVLDCKKTILVTFVPVVDVSLNAANPQASFIELGKEKQILFGMAGHSKRLMRHYTDPFTVISLAGEMWYALANTAPGILTIIERHLVLR